MASRRSGRRYTRSRSSSDSLPDWMWGLGLGVLALAVIGGFFLIGGVTGGGADPCDQELEPLANSEISAEAFVENEAALARVQEMLNAGDIIGADRAFYGPVHNFTHNVDPPVREINESVAKDLCRAVIDLEESLPRRGDPIELAMKVQRVRDALADSAEVLGYPRP